MVNLTPKEIQEILHSEDAHDEIVALNLLGLHESALEVAQKTLAQSTGIAPLREGIKTALSTKRYDLAAEYADRLRAIEGRDKFSTQLISLAYNYAGRHLDAYTVCREAVELPGSHGETDFYSLACRASSIGLAEESLTCILRQFQSIPSREHYLIRKAFLDSELADAWNLAATATPHLAQALAVYVEDWESVVSENLSPEPERWVDHSDLRRIPREFHVLLRPRCASTFETPPIKAAEHPQLHKRYLEWQATTVAPRVQSFIRYMKHCDRALLEAQPLFAEFQAAKGRFGLARTHLQHILKYSPTPCDLPDIPLLAPLIAEFRAQHAESPEAFQLLIQRSGEVTEEVFATLPPVNRASGLAALYLGNRHYAEGRFLQAVEAWCACAKIWPWDSTPLLNSIFALQRANRFDEASKVLRLVKSKDLPKRTRLQIKRNIAYRNNARNPCHQRPRIPTPEFGGFWPGANKEFIRWLKKTHPRTTTK